MNKEKFIEHIKFGIQIYRKMKDYCSEDFDEEMATYYMGKENALQELFVRVEKGEFDDTHSN